MYKCICTIDMNPIFTSCFPPYDWKTEALYINLLSVLKIEMIKRRKRSPKCFLKVVRKLNNVGSFLRLEIFVRLVSYKGHKVMTTFFMY